MSLYILPTINFILLLIVIYLIVRPIKKPAITERAISATKKIIKSAHGYYTLENKHEPLVYDEESQYKDEMKRKGILD